jgi:hypothetical protein
MFANLMTALRSCSMRSVAWSKHSRQQGNPEVAKKPRLRLVGDHDPASIFDDLDSLRAQSATPAYRRRRSVATFARIPHDRALQLYRHRLSGAAWVVLIELDRMILKAGGQNPVRFWSSRLRAVGLANRLRTKALRQLAAAGVVKVKQRGHGLSPLITHLWYPLQE